MKIIEAVYADYSYLQLSNLSNTLKKYTFQS